MTASEPEAADPGEGIDAENGAENETEASESADAPSSGPTPAVSAMANLPHGVGPVGMSGECAFDGRAFRFSSSGDDRFNIVTFDSDPPTVEAANAFLGEAIYAFTAIDTIEVSAERYVIAGTGAEAGGEDEAEPMSFTIVCSA